MDKKDVVYFIMGHYSTIRKKEISPFVTTWMDREDTTLSEISQTEKDKYYTVSLTGVVKLIETEGKSGC